MIDVKDIRPGDMFIYSENDCELVLAVSHPYRSAMGRRCIDVTVLITSKGASGGIRTGCYGLDKILMAQHVFRTEQ